MKRLLLSLAAALTTMVAMAEVTVGVSNVVSRQRYPWNGLVDVDCEVYCSDPATNINLYLSAKDNAAGKSLSVRRVRLEGSTAFTNALEVKAGKHRVIWDAGTDAPNVVLDDVTIAVHALVGADTYLVIDVSGGPNAASYPVSYLDAEPQGGWTDEYKTDKIVLRLILPGTFTMGSPEGESWHRYCEDQHTVTLSKPFYMGIFEITQKQYELVMDLKPSSYKGDMRPVECVSYNMIRGSSLGSKWPSSSEVDSASFIGRIRAKTGLDDFDLPTEAQWEYACRAGTTTAFNNGKDLTEEYQDPAMDEVGCYYYNYMDNKGGYTSGHKNVGSYQPNEWGLYDMHGNVFEWCLDWHSYANLSDATDPVGASSGSSRVRRGGVWGNHAFDCRSAYRDDCMHPEFYDSGSGFRLSRTLP